MQLWFLCFTEVVIAPPDIFLLIAAQVAKPNIEVSAQNVFDKGNGAFTGETSTTMLKEHNINWVIIGHSERRTILKETDSVRQRTNQMLYLSLKMVMLKTSRGLIHGTTR